MHLHSIWYATSIEAYHLYFLQPSVLLSCFITYFDLKLLYFEIILGRFQLVVTNFLSYVFREIPSYDAGYCLGT